ncbi:MAG: hypothetical protein K2N73_07080, partial [Lachnospiraceae bacterium]|nr:hypothetical protein [Lachnospiraceae bacterium]
KSVIIHTSITYKLMKTGVGVNCNDLSLERLGNMKKYLQASDFLCIIFLLLAVSKSTPFDNNLK